jgi:non-ribosomal peptide synthetase component F
LLILDHIAGDGWSLGVLGRELASIYGAFSQGLPSPLPELDFQAADYSQWERERLAGERLERHLEYWRTQLAGAPALDLPTDRPRPAVQSFEGAIEKWRLDSVLSEQVKALGKSEGTTLFMTLLAAFSVLVSRHSGQTDMVIGTPVANRTHEELEGLIGLFLNTLALRIDLEGDPTFIELLAHVREVTRAALEHQDLPFERLVEELQTGRQNGHDSPIRVAFAQQNVPTNAFDIPGLDVTRLDCGVESVPTDLQWFFGEQDGAVVGDCAYNRGLFDATTIRRMASHFVKLLEGIVADPHQRIGSLALLEESEREQLLAEWNDTATEYPRDKCIHQLFEEQAEVTPDAVAVVFEDRQLTYRELNAQSNQLAHHLHELGVGRDVLVGICVERSLEMLIGIIGILKAGGAYVPLDPAYPCQRLAFMLQDSEARVLLTQQSLLDRLPDHTAKVICLDSDWHQIAIQPTANLPIETTPEDLAYVIYTSGSTGKPKGVLTTHDNLLNFSFWHLRTYDVTSADRVTQVASLSFDAASGEIWPQLAAGASLHLVKPELLIDPHEFARWLIDRRITLAFAPAPIAEQLVMLEWPKDVALRALLSGGDKMHRSPPRGLPFDDRRHLSAVSDATGNVVPHVGRA